MSRTPGPWTHLDQEHAISIISGGIVIADVFKPDDNCVSPAMSETLDNAHLIAAAPELLEALRSLVNKLKDKLPALQYHSCRNEFDRALQVIAKAEGWKNY